MAIQPDLLNICVECWTLKLTDALMAKLQSSQTFPALLRIGRIEGALGCSFPEGVPGPIHPKSGLAYETGFGYWYDEEHIEQVARFVEGNL